MEEPKKITVNDHDDDVPTDMTVNEQGVMEESHEEASTNGPASPDASDDVSPPPHDEVIHEAPASEPEQDSSSEDHGTEDSEKPVEDMSVVKAEPAHMQEGDGVVTPEEQKEKVVLPTGADPDVHKPHEHANNKKAVVAIILALAAVLVVIVVLLFVKTNKTAEKTTTQSQTTTKAPAQNTTQQAAPVTANDVDTTIQEVDETLTSLDDTKDFATDDISDKALGLQ
jgi:hypothetical protein